MSRIAAICSLIACLTLSSCGREQQWPARPITLICPWSAGGGTDRVSRQMAVQLEAELGVPVNVVNATGGGGVTGHTRGATAVPDGYTLTMATVELNMLHWRGLCPITPRSFRPLTKLNEDSAAIFVLNSSPWSSVGDVESAVQNADQPLKASGTAAGGIWHLALAGWFSSRNLPTENVTWISINGSAPSLQELMAGGVDVVCCSIPEAQSLLDAGEIRCLGVMSDERCPAAPDVPTFKEQGVDWSMGGWRGLMYPKGVPEDRVGVMQSALAKITRSDEFKEFMTNAGFNVSVIQGEEFGEFLDTADEDFGRILNQPGMKQQQKAPVGRYFVPGILGALGVLIGLVGFVLSRRAGSPLVEGESVATRSETESPTDARLVVGFIVAILLFLIACQTVGYVIAGSALLLAMLLMLKTRVSWAALIVVVAVPGLYQLFAGVLGVPLPWGWLGW
ncbi:MAG: tripartite tricarboxylate transporter TctB family protein [Planctomycetaceae bacterium]|nr:tripartite tricarboxylate transporter TctB family protein [Planctomycetaceae bacterium]MCB9952594.1 tripartite tricarboxylate transporter TctB family protein [Planctomycetaceae bacterium]